MKCVRLTAVVAALLFGGAVAHAELIATPLSGDSRLVQFNYDEDNTFLVLTKPKAVTHIQFSGDETVQSVAAGDTAQWELTPTKNRKNLFIKPKFDSIETSMTVLTDKRTYQFVLRSTGDGKKWYQRVSWMYQGTMLLESDVQLEQGGSTGVMQPASPTAQQVAVAAPNVDGLKPSDIRFGYEVSGDAPFKPLTVFDDGKFTYLRMPADIQELPALFAVIEDQEYALVNYVTKGEYLVAQRLLTEGVLKLGKKEVRVVKKKPRTFLGMTLGEAD